MFELTGRIAVVTGAAGAIGKAIASALDAQGATVIAADLAPGMQDVLRLDVTDASSWEEFSTRVGDLHGRLDILVNCAGIAPMASIEATDAALWRKAMAVNVEGTAMGMRSFLPLLRKAAGTHKAGPVIINLASAASRRPAAFSAAYCASKAAVAMLTKVAAVEFEALGYGVRVNSVHPGVVESPMMDEILERYSQSTGSSIADLKDNILSNYSVKRFAAPAEIAAAVVYLASDEAAYLNGAEQVVDGGYLSR